MGRLLGLELHNFKSFKGTVVVGFGDSNFTSIIGPNGAGKSNMMDAISFVLGIQPSHLRTQNLKDLIYRGRVDGDNEPTKCDYAHVVAIYEKSPGETTHLMRSILMSGSSDYKINNKSVTALQYQMFLKQESILVKARNFLVFQGDIENIAAQEPAQLSKLIETISGSAEFAEEYDRLKDEKDKALALHTEIFSKKRHLNTESKQYKEQMRERELFETTLLEKNNLRKIVNLYKIFHNERKHFQIKANLRRVSEAINSTKEKMSESLAQLQDLVASHARESLELKNFDSQISKLQKESGQARRDLLPLQSKQKLLQNKISLTEQKIADLSRDLDSQKEHRNSLAQKLEDSKSLIKEFERRTRELEQQTKIPDEGIKQYETLRREFLSRSGSALEEELSGLTLELETYQNSIRNFDQQSGSAQARIAELTAEIEQNLQGKLDLLQAQLDELIQLKTSKEKAKDELIQAKQRIVSSELELNAELREILVGLDEISSQQKETKKQKRLRDNVSLLKTLLREGSIKGIVYELVSASQKKYETALLTVLGGDFDSIIVDTTANAHKCIEILKERRAGIASFIPLDSVINDQINLNYLRSIHEQARPAIDVVKFDDPSIERAIQYVVGDTVIVDDLEIARELKWNPQFALNSKIVSLDGSVLHKSGLMTGGQQQQRIGPSLRINKDGLNQLEQRRDEINKKLAELSEEKPNAVDINNLSEEISQIEDQIPGLKSKLKIIERQIFEKEQEITFNTDLLKESEQRRSEKQESSVELQKTVSDCESRIRDLQKQVYGEFCQKYKLHSIADYEALHGPAMRRRAREKAELEKNTLSLKNKVEFQEERVAQTSQRITRLRQDLEKITSQCRETEASVDNKIIRLNDLEKQLSGVQGEKANLEKHLDERLKETKKLESEVHALESDVRSQGREHTQSEELLMKVDAERFNMLKNCKMEDVDLPLEDGFLDSLSLDVENVSEVAYQVHVDYSLLDVKYQETYSARTEAELRARIEAVENELRALTPNSKAVERLRQVDQKLKEFDREFSKAKHDVNRVTAKFEEVSQQRKDLFMAAFEHISGNIDRIYKTLTKSSASPLGGSAYLTLEDDEQPFAAGIKYHAMPPMKRFRDIDLLSGGEKTIAALALLFAIHSFHSSPFFVLDEVDASLDNANVKRIGEYIRESAGPGFQFIVISLKSALFENSDALVGIYRDQRENASRTVTLDLRKYSDKPQTIPAHTEIAAEG